MIKGGLELLCYNFLSSFKQRLDLLRSPSYCIVFVHIGCA